MKPKNQKQFNWSYVRFYLMWLLTTMLALIPLAVLFSGWVKCDDCKNQSKAEQTKGVEKVNYNEVAIGLDSLIFLVKDIDINNDSRGLRRTLDVLDSYRDDYTIEDNKALSKKLRNLAGEVYGLTEQYEEAVEKNDRKLDSKDEKISNLENQITVLRGQLNSMMNRPQ